MNSTGNSASLLYTQIQKTYFRFPTLVAEVREEKSSAL